MLSDPAVVELIKQTFNILSSAIGHGVSYEVPETLRYALENNAFTFSGFKTFHTLREVGLSLLTPNGDIKPFSIFLNDVKAINYRYNHNYLRAEYQQAVAASQMAVRWHEFEKDGDRYDLQYRTANDSHVREEHAILHNTTLPASDPFWDSFLPPNGWGCRCTTVQVRKGKYPTSDPQLAMKRGQNCTDGAKRKIFRFNPGKAMRLYPEQHPYYKAPAVAKNIVEQQSAEQQRKFIAQRRREIREYMADHLDEPLVNPDFSHIAFLSGKSVKEFINQPHKHYREKNELLMDIKRVFNSAKYLGINPNYQAPGLTASHIFEIELCDEKSWLIAREYSDGTVKLYSCSDNAIIATNLIQQKKP